MGKIHYVGTLFTRLTSLWHHDGCRCWGAKLALGHRHRPCWLDCDWFHINHIMWYTHHVTTIKQEMVHRGQEVGNLLICLFWRVHLLTMITFYVSQYQPTTKHNKALSYRKSSRHFVTRKPNPLHSELYGQFITSVVYLGSNYSTQHLYRCWLFVQLPLN